MHLHWGILNKFYLPITYFEIEFTSYENQSAGLSTYTIDKLNNASSDEHLPLRKPLRISRSTKRRLKICNNKTTVKKTKFQYPVII